MGVVPGLAARVVRADGTGLVVHGHALAIERIPVGGLAGRVEGEAVGQGLPPLGQQAQVVVEGVVLHHGDDDVVEREGASGYPTLAGRVGKGIRQSHSGAHGRTR